jgi:hypothetical protein
MEYFMEGKRIFIFGKIECPKVQHTQYFSLPYIANIKHNSIDNLN